MKAKSFSRGFTLIELLVVIAIIGILTSVVLASLNSARSKGGDASVKANLDGIRAQAELFYDTPKSYNTSGSAVTTCPSVASATAGSNLFTDPNVSSAIVNAVSNGNGGKACGANSTGSAYAVEVELKSTPGTYWCVASNGLAGTTTSATIASTAFACQ